MDYFKLANGMDVVLKTRTHASNVSVRLVINVGFRHFPCGKQETPHFLEHLVSMGTSKRSEADLRRLIENHGGSLIGATTSTETVYKLDIFDKHLFLGIDTLYEMMMDRTITPKSLESARSIIYREHKGKYPWLIRWLYEKGLFKKAAIKTRELLLGPGVQCSGVMTPDGITEAEIMEAYRNYYVPENMTLVVVGNFDRPTLASQIKATFGKLPAKASNGHKLISPPYSTEQKETTGILSTLVGSDGAVAIAYRTDGKSSPDFYALSLLGRYALAIVWERVRIRESMSYTPSAIYHAEDDFGIFVVLANVSLDEMERAEVLLEGAVDWLKKGWIEAEQMEALKRGLIWELAVRYDSNGSLADYYVSSLPQLERDGRLIGLETLIKGITPEDLHRVANRYLQNDSRVIARETPTLTYTQFFAGLGILMLAVPGAAYYFVRRFLKRRHSRAMEKARWTYRS